MFVCAVGIDGVKPSSPFFSNMAVSQAMVQICCDVVMAPPAAAQMDLATIGLLAKGTGGQIYYYPAFQSGKKNRSEGLWPPL